MTLGNRKWAHGPYQGRRLDERVPGAQRLPYPCAFCARKFSTAFGAAQHERAKHRACLNELLTETAENQMTETLAKQREGGTTMPLWSPEQVERLNAYQAAQVMHPFTCPALNHPDDGDRDDRILVATADGWRCKVCDYAQDWAHDFMLNFPLPGEPRYDAMLSAYPWLGTLVSDDAALRAAVRDDERRHPAIAERWTEADRALVDAAAGRAPGAELVELTPDRLRSMMGGLKARIAVEDARHAEILARLTEDEKIAVVAWAMRAICEHARDNASFRYLIYERLGFSTAAYVPLYRAGGMEISNYFELPPRRTSEGPE